MTSPHACRRCGSTARRDWNGGICPACALEFGWKGWKGHEHSDSGYPTTDSGAAPRRLGDYQLLEVLGHGGMGVVYRALQVSLDRPVAVKMIHPGLFMREAERRRFRAEAEAAARIRHPHIVAIYDVGEHEGQPYFVMELVEGRSLAEVLREGPLDAERAARVASLVAEAIHEAHSLGVLHRDLKPSNLMLDRQDRPRILDFGLAKLATADSDQTGPGVPLGSPSYMPPEQALGQTERTDARSDVYSLGAVLYEMLTGRPPFRASSTVETLRWVVERAPVSPRSIDPRVPRELETICLVALAKERTSRYPSAQAMALDLQRFVRHEPIQARPQNWVGRLRLWARREPVAAAFGTGLLVALVAGTVGLGTAWQRELQLRRRAEFLEERARRNLYAADMNLALQAVERGDDGTARRLLASYASSDDGAAGAAGAAPTERRDLRGFEWRYLRHAIRPDPHRALTGHQDLVTGLAVSPEDRRIVSVGSDGWLREQDGRGEGDPVRPSSLGFHASSLAMHPSGERLAVGGDTTHGGVVIDRAGQLLANLPSGFLQRVVFSPDGHWLLVGQLTGWNGDPGPMLVCDSHGREAGRMAEAGGHAAFCGSRGWLATGSWQGRIRLWRWPDAIPGETRPPEPTRIGEFEPAGKVLALGFSPDGTKLASSNEGGDLQIWDVPSGREVHRVVATLSGYPRCVAFSPDGRWLVTGGDDRLLRIRDAETFEVTSIHRGHHGSIWALAWAPEGTGVIAAASDGSIRIWPWQPPPPREVVLTNVVADYYKSALAISPDSRWVTLGTSDGGLALWDIHTGAQKGRVALGTDRLHAAFSADGGELVVSLGIESVRRFSVPDLRPVGIVALQSPEGPSLGAELSPGGHWFVGLGTAAGAEGTLHLWDAREGFRKATWRAHPSQVRGLRFSPDLRWLATGGLDHTTRLWDLRTLQPAAVLEGASNAVTVLAFSPDSRTLAAGGWDHTLRLWRVPTGELLTVLPVPDGVPVSEFLPDGKTLAIATEATGIRLYDLATQRDTCTLRWPGSHPYRYVRCSPDGTAIAWYSRDGRLLLSQAP